MMKRKKYIQQLRSQSLGAKEFCPETLDWIAQENLWNIWVPEKYDGLELGLTDGLDKLMAMAAIDGSLGWTITLCSGANYFIGNLNKEAVDEIFSATSDPVLGGSGGAFGTAEKHGDSYCLSGKWRYATGAPYLTHFTLNARITQDGSELKTQDGEPKVYSFVLPKEKVDIIEDWDTMGLRPTATYSFKVNQVEISQKYRFHYGKVHLPQDIYKIPFALFADLTLWANYIGMAQHYREEAQHALDADKLSSLNDAIEDARQALFAFAGETESFICKEEHISEAYKQAVHKKAVESIRHLSQCFIELHPLLGMKASRANEQLNQIFRDYFTATQHYNFVD